MGKVGYRHPPIETRFPVNRPYAPHKGHKGPYFVPLLQKLLKKKITFEDPETQKLIKGTVIEAVAWRLILNATQGEYTAIRELLDRLDGKVPNIIKDHTEDEELLNSEFEIIHNGHKEETIKRFAKFLQT
ncbi:MAG: hypothetical protein PHY56_04850 [Candidatus Omnitrophica bacterium]|nr:hypothetical protein [Candidatus Omnitrophota bacterium]